MADKKEMQAKYMEFQMLQQQMKDVVGQIEEISNRLYEVESIIVSVNETSEVESGSEILVPISSGIFIKAKASETKNFLVNIGAGNVSTKSTEEVIKMLEKQKVELLNFQTELTKEAENFERQLMAMQKELQEINKN